MRRLPALVAALVLVAVPAPAVAHQLQVVDPGGAELDLGTADPARLIHAVLVDEGDELVVTVMRGETPLDVQLLIPDREPESDAPANELPTLSARWTAGGLTTAHQGDSDPISDEATGIGYRLVVPATIPPGRGPATVIVARGGAPTRVALRIGPPTTFAATDAERTPRAALEARLWIETPPPGYEPAPGERGDSDAAPDRRYVWYGVVIALLGLLVAVWWIARGWAASRRRGAERALAEREDA